MDSKEDSKEDVGLSSPTDPARLSVSIPRGLYKRFKMHALNKNTTISALIIELIKRELEGT